MNFLMILASAFSIGAGIPWAFVRNCVWPPIIAWMISRFPFRVGCAFSHNSSLVLIVFSIGSQGVISSTLLPIQAPSILTASPSWAMRILAGSWVWSVGLIFLHQENTTSLETSYVLLKPLFSSWNPIVPLEMLLGPTWKISRGKKGFQEDIRGFKRGCVFLMYITSPILESIHCLHDTHSLATYSYHSDSYWY